MEEVKEFELLSEWKKVGARKNEENEEESTISSCTIS